MATTIETLRKNAHLRFRRPKDAAVLRMADKLEHGMSSWFSVSTSFTDAFTRADQINMSDVSGTTLRRSLRLF